MRRSSASSSRSGRPAKSATTCAVRSSAVGPSPPLVTIRSAPSARMNSSAESRSAGRSPVISTCASSIPSSASRSASHGPLRSRTRPASTSVPVITKPARTLGRSPAVGQGGLSGQDCHPGRPHAIAERLRAIRSVAPLPVDRRSPPPLPTVTLNERRAEGALPVAGREHHAPTRGRCRSRRPRTPTPAALPRPRAAPVAPARARRPASPRAAGPRGRGAIPSWTPVPALPPLGSSSLVRPSTSRNPRKPRTSMSDADPAAWEGPPGGCVREPAPGGEGRHLQLLRLLEAGAVLLHQQVGIEPEELRVGAQEGLHVGRAGQHDPLFVLERAQVLRADLRRLLDRRDVDLVADARLAQQRADVCHRGCSGRVRVRPASGRRWRSGRLLRLLRRRPASGVVRPRAGRQHTGHVGFRDQHLARLRALVAGDHAPPLEHVDQPARHACIRPAGGAGPSTPRRSGSAPRAGSPPPAGRPGRGRTRRSASSRSPRDPPAAPPRNPARPARARHP